MVMYGGISLAIYMNGVAQEFLNLVLSTAEDEDGNRCLETKPGEPGHKGKPVGTPAVYRELADRLEQRSGLRHKFIVDILSGTSAGGINAMFLGKAIGEKKSFAPLRDMWINEGDIGVLLDDKESYRGLGWLTRRAPKSLLNSRRMYTKLVSALDEMDRTPLLDGALSSTTELVGELDVHMTATDIVGRITPVYLGLNEPDHAIGAMAKIYQQLELEHRAVFHFRHCAAEATRDFVPENNPFLAFVGRCTSSIVPAFEPMRLEDAKEVLQSNGELHRYQPRKWATFFGDYWRGVQFLEQTSDAAAIAQARADFELRPFGDGGYLDNKPFGNAFQSLKLRRADTAVRRVVFYLEPHPEMNSAVAKKGKVRGEAPNVFEHALAARGLAHTQNISERVREMRQLSDFAARVKRSREAVSSMKVEVPWGLHVESVADQLSSVLAEILGLGSDVSLAPGLRLFVLAGLKLYYNGLDPASEGSDAPDQSIFKSQSRREQAVNDLDYSYVMRRAEYFRGKLEGSMLDVARAKGLAEKQVSAFVQLNSIVYDSQSGQSDSGNSADTPPKTKELQLPRLGSSKLRFSRVIAALEADRMNQPPVVLDDNEQVIVDNLRALNIKIWEVCRVQMRAAYGETSDAQAQGLQRATDLLAPDHRAEAMKNLVSATVRLLDLNGQRESIDQWARDNGLNGEIEQFVREDAITFPVLYSAGLADSYALDLVRISPTDATSITGEMDDPAKKLAGIGLGHFSGFLTREGRIVDIMWGRLDAAEIILKTYSPGNYRDLLSIAQQAIIAETLSTVPRVDPNSPRRDKLSEAWVKIGAIAALVMPERSVSE